MTCVAFFGTMAPVKILTASFGLISISVALSPAFISPSKEKMIWVKSLSEFTAYPSMADWSNGGMLMFDKTSSEVTRPKDFDNGMEFEWNFIFIESIISIAACIEIIQQM